MTHQSIVEVGGEILSEERNVWFHYSCGCDIVVFIICTIFVALALLPRTRRPVEASFPLETRFDLSYGSDASVTAGYPAGFHFCVYLLAFDSIIALDAGCGGEGPVALNQLLRHNTCVTL